MNEKEGIKLYGRVILSGKIKLITGLHIGGAAAAISIGGLDNPVLRNVANGQPYIPGSSLRGKMRSLAEKFAGARQNRSIGRDVTIHICDNAASYARCPVCRIWGIPGEMGFSGPTRLVVRDVALEGESVEWLSKLRTDLPFTEVKWEAAIDRVTSAATPRQLERVPAGAVFAPFEMVYSVYEREDRPLFGKLVEAMQLLEDDYLGGQGSRGGGKIAFDEIRLLCKPRDSYTLPDVKQPIQQYPNLGELVGSLPLVEEWLTQTVPVE